MNDTFLKEILLAPGPTPLHPEVMKAMITPMISHRTSKFQSIYGESEDFMKIILNTNNSVVFIPSSGTGALEAAINNCLTLGDKIIVAINGRFAEIFSIMAKTNGMNVIEVDTPWGQPVDPELMARIVGDNKDAKAVMIIHNETSTGILSDIATISHAIREVNNNILIMVDAISSLGGTEFRMDAWDIDIVVSASQKALMGPPGLAMISLSERAWERAFKTTFHGYYFDLKRIHVESKRRMTLTTPAVNVFFGLHRALELILQENASNYYQRLAGLRDYLLKGITSTSIKLFGDPKFASPTVTALVMPLGYDSELIKSKMYEQHAVVLGPGLGRIAKTTLRVGHMGYVSEHDLDCAIKGFRNILDER